MTVFDRLERRFGWLAFPGFLRYYALFHVLVFVLQYIRPDIGQLFEFDRAKILSGEVWRVATLFFASSEFGGRNLTSVIFLLFAVSFFFMISDGLEEAWGSFKSSLFYYAGILLVLAANFAYPFAIPSSGTALYGAAFLAYATLYPKVEVRLFMIIPVQIRFLGIFAAVGILLKALSEPILLPYYLVAFANYFLWAGIPALRGTVQTIATGQRKKRFNAAKAPADEAFHTCVACQKTDISDRHLDFRIGRDGQEYCNDHLPE